MVAYVQQHDGENFTSSSVLGLVCPCCRVRSAPVDGGGGRPPGGCVVAALRLQWWLGVLLLAPSGRLPPMVVEAGTSSASVVLLILAYGGVFSVRSVMQFLPW